MKKLVTTLHFAAFDCTGYGLLNLSQSNTLGTPLLLTACSSVSLCPFSSIRPSIYTTEALNHLNFTNIVNLVLNPNILLSENFYRFKLSVTNDIGEAGFAEIDIYTESLPANGRIETIPESGVPLLTIFQARTLGWTDRVGDGPFFYRFGFRFTCSNSESELLEQSNSKCIQWMTGLSLENTLQLRVPATSNFMDLELVVHAVDKHGANQEEVTGFEGILCGNISSNNDSSLQNSSIESYAILNASVLASTWRDSMASLTSFLWSVQKDHNAMPCDSLQEMSQTLNLSRYDIYYIKMMALEHITNDLYYQIPLTDSHYHIILSLLNMATNLTCVDFPGENQSALSGNDIRGVLRVLEDIVHTSVTAERNGNLIRKGLATHNVALILSIYKNLIELHPAPFRSDVIRESLVRVMPSIGYGACSRQSLLETPVLVHQSGFASFKSSRTNLPVDYSTECSVSSSCLNTPVTVGFGNELLLDFLQWECDAADESMCSGVCLSTYQLEVDILWQGFQYSSLHKTPILHMSILNPITGIPVGPFNSSEFIITFILVSTDSSLLECVMWNDSNMLWENDNCRTNRVSPSTVACHCAAFVSGFLSVVERCPSGSYGERCNESELAWDHDV